MYPYSVSKFVSDQREELECQSVWRKMLDDKAWLEEKFAKDLELANMYLARFILGHNYGELLAVKYRKWIYDNYVIGSFEGNHVERRTRSGADSSPEILEEERLAA